MTTLVLSPDSAALHEEELKPASDFNYIAIKEQHGSAGQSSALAWDDLLTRR